MTKILHIYSIEKLPSSGIILFSTRSRVMSVVKTKIWRTFSHAGVIYPSSVTGVKKPWVSYLDEIYGMISMPLAIFLSSNDFIDWVIRVPSVAFDEKRWAVSIKKNITRDSNLNINPDGTLGGSFETELKHILGLDEDDRKSNNIGFVKDVIDDYYEDVSRQPTKKISFDDDQHVFGIQVRGGSEDALLKTIKQILGLVNITIQSIQPPINYFMNPMLIDLSDIYYRDGGIMYPISHNTRMESDRDHAASIVANMFSAGLGNDDIFTHFSEEIDTTDAAKRTRDDMSREMVSDVISSLKTQLAMSINIMGEISKKHKEDWNGSLEDLFASLGVLLTHLNYDDVNLDVKKYIYQQ